ncbi:MAG: hypothetical protein V4760_18745 [Bdellovibrionota bacterium]
MNRRSFVKLSSLLLADLAIGGPLSCTTVEPLPRPLSNVSKGKVVVALSPLRSTGSVLRILDWDTRRFEDVELPIGIAHALMQDPHHPSSLFAFELFGDVIRFDLESKKVVRMSASEKSIQSNGHGASSRSGELFACTQLEKGKGSHVAVRRTRDLSTVARLPKECDGAHQVVALPGSGMMAVGNLQSLDRKLAGAITFFEEETWKIVNRVEFDFPVLHVLALSPTEVVGVTMPDPPKKVSMERFMSEDEEAHRTARTLHGSKEGGPLYRASVDGTKKIFMGDTDKANFVGSFGLAGVSKGRFLSGHAGSGRVVLWKEFEIEHVFEIRRPRGMIASPDGREFMVVSGNELQIHSLETRELVHRFASWPPVAAMSGYQA